MGRVMQLLCICGAWRGVKCTKPLILLGGIEVVAGDGIEPPTQGFSVLRLTGFEKSCKVALVRTGQGFRAISTALYEDDKRTQKSR